MKPLLDFFQQGGPVMYAILLLSVVLYTRCCSLLYCLWSSRRQTVGLQERLAGQTGALVRRREQLEDYFRQQRLALGAMVAAAPLLGLLGTVSGMAKTFESLTHWTSADSMDGLAQGISEVLVATQSGLAVAIPALLLLYIAHRLLQRHVLLLNQLEQQPAPASRP